MVRRLLPTFIAAASTACSLLLEDGYSSGERGAVEDGGPSGELDVVAPDAGTDAGTEEAGAASGYRAVVLEDGPVAYWPLDETSGTVVHDVTGHGNDGVLEASGSWGAAGIPGAHGTSLSLSGTGGARLGDRFDFAGRVPFSLEAWVRPAAEVTTWRFVFDKLERKGGSPFVGTYLYVNDTDPFPVTLERWANGTIVQEAGRPNAPVPTDRFTHIVATVNETRCSIFVDGVRFQGPIHEADIPDVGVPMVLGPNWIGDLDEMAIYDKELDAERVLAHYRAGSGQR